MRLMRFLRSLFGPPPAHPGRRPPVEIQFENLTDEQHTAILHALECSDMDSSSDLVARTDALIERLIREGVATPIDSPKPVGTSLPTT